jgi:hypothetical protein
MWELGLPLSPVEFSSHCRFYKLSRPWLLVSAAAPAFSSRLVVRDFPSPHFSTQCAPPSLLHVFIVLIAYYSVSLFFPGWVLVCPGGYAALVQGCLWEYCVLLSSPCGPCLPKPSGCCCLAVAQEPSWFLPLTWSEDAKRRLEVWRSQCFASSWWFFLSQSARIWMP